MRRKKKPRRAKRKTAKTPYNFTVEPATLPESYGRTTVVLLPVQPYLAHVFWEIASGDLAKAEKRLRRDARSAQPVLRFCDVTSPALGSTTTGDYFDVDIDLRTGNWYVHLWNPGRSYFVEVGFRPAEGGFVSLRRSNVAHFPPARPSLETDEGFQVQERERQRAEGARPSAGRPSTLRIEAVGRKQLAARQIPALTDSEDVLRRKLGEAYSFRGAGRGVFDVPKPARRDLAPGPFRKPDHDLVELNERSYTSGISS